MSESGGEPKFQFLRNGDADPSELDWNKGIESARQAISEAMNAKNIAFLLGAGCSSLMRDKKVSGDKEVSDKEVSGDKEELGIATMAPLAKEFCGEALKAKEAVFYGDPPVVGAAPAPWRLTKDELDYLVALGIDLAKDYSRNLERLMEVLFAQRFVLRHSENPDFCSCRAVLNGIIEKVQNFLWTRVTQGAFAKSGDTTVRDLYERFYKKLVLRNRSLPRPWVFTTNYDHFSELAMDRLGIPYANGFSGVVERRFNPAIFRYALAEQLDVASRKWIAVDAFVYLCKLHGSVTWTEDDHGLFPIKEVWPPDFANQMLIYPTPAKQNSSLGSPYADLFREFQSRIVREQSVLITAGYAFGDEHLNNIIYQALTIPTFRLVIFAAPDTAGEIAKLRALRDPRIWIIGGHGPAEGTKAHYFDMIVEHFMPQRPSDRIDDAVRKVLSELAPKRDDETKDGEA